MSDLRYYATGKRKNAIARVWIQPGSGNINVNKLAFTDYFGGAIDQKIATRPFVLTDNTDKFDVYATLKGGGKAAQAEALRHGIAKALLDVDLVNRQPLKKAGLLTRDARVKERKKYGKKAARASFQFSKR
ncbi:MAG: 30S ribosomal protein S9 [Desulfurivibrio sp.]|jgi:small subunit ribosomal protein S9|nr:MAG: 30S ribosomal protein S9 [Desulfurivibrio sp.]